ncbi:sigma-70 family RNA polymerase sigma factor [Kitasatospora hibisci]|uniref:sigma-70 family RNA polymerase sigma factor n=1 Tax=Kitasatospora hibisci TaxID=3369522 RepID=UPI003753EEA7
MKDHADTSLADLTDGELTSLIRGGSTGGEVSELYARHREAVLAHARACCRDPHTAEDLASEAFARTLDAVRSGAGPAESWRPYLLTVVRNTAAAWAEGGRRSAPTDDIDHLQAALPQVAGGEESALRRENDALLATSFRTLPERWQQVLWYTLVEEEPAQDVGRRLGLSASGVWSLAERAREGLREAYLTAHIDGRADSEECRHYRPQLAAAVRRDTHRRNRRLDAHLAECRACHSALGDLADLNARLRAVLPLVMPLWHGGAGAVAGGGAAGALTPHTGALTTAGSAGGTAAGTGTTLTATGWLGIAGATLAVGVLGAFAYLGGGDGTAADPAPAPSATAASRDIAAPPAGPAPSTTDASASASAPASPGASDRTPTGSPSASSPTGRTRLRIDSTDRCMEIPGGSTAVGAQPQEAACTGSTWQNWDVIDLPAAGQQVSVRNAASGQCLTYTDTTDDKAPVRQEPCDPANALQAWTLKRPQDGLVSFVTSNNTRLGLKDWAPAVQGKSYGPLIATTHYYYNSPSLRFRVDR